MAEKTEKSAGRRSLWKHAALAMMLVVALAGGSWAWAATTNIAGAVVASGLIVIEGGSKRVQHPEGGVVKEILARNEDAVTAGSLLIRLDGTSVQASLEVVDAQLREALARHARLTAESLALDTLAPSTMAPNWPDDPRLEILMAMQTRLLTVRRASINGQRDRVTEQVTQLEEQIVGLEAQLVGVRGELALLRQEGDQMEKLYADQLVQAGRVNELLREQARATGEEGRLLAQIAATRASISERSAIMGQIEQDFQSGVLDELQTAGREIAELLQRKIAAEDRLARLEIRAPMDGVIHQSTVETVGGVIGAGETLMLVVPQTNTLVIDAQISPLEIDRLHIGQPVITRLMGLDARTMPDLDASIRSISPDLTTDPQSGYRYYSVRIDIAADQTTKLPEGLRLVPGMPVEVFAQTGERTVWNYLVQPLLQQINRAFREQ